MMAVCVRSSLTMVFASVHRQFAWRSGDEQSLSHADQTLGPSPNRPTRASGNRFNTPWRGARHASHKKNTVINLSKIVRFTLFTDGVRIEKDSGRDQYFLGEAETGKSNTCS